MKVTDTRPVADGRLRLTRFGMVGALFAASDREAAFGGDALRIHRLRPPPAAA